MLPELNVKYPQSFLLEYYEKCTSGEIIIGQELLLCLDNLIEDLQDVKYQFDMTDPHKRIKFVETKCKHSIAPFAGKPFILELWQKAFIESIYGFRIYDDEVNEWVKRFTEILLIIGRKNGKSTLCAAISNCEFFVGDVGTNIICASNDFEQSAIVFDEINNMREESKSLERVSRKNIKGIFMGNPKQKNKKGKFSHHNKAKIKKLSAKSGAKEGRNIDLATIDEIHEMKNSDLVLPIKQSMSTKISPTLFEITTEGFTADGYLDERLSYARRVLKKEVPNDRFLVWLYTMDSEEEIYQDRSSWVKANPMLGVAKKWSYLDGLVEQSKTETAVRAYMLSKDFNTRQNSASAWLTEADIVNPEKFNPEQFAGKFFIGALDFAETTDLCNAKALFFDPVTGYTHTLTMYFICENKADAMLEDNNDKNPEKKDYRKWASQGLVTICPGDEVNPADVVAWFYGLYKAYKMKPYKMFFDNWHAVDFKKQFAANFGEGILERINMDFASLSNPMRLLESALKNKTLIYNDNEMDKWNLRNVSIKMDPIGRIMPIKRAGQSKNRIDGALGFMISFAGLSRYRSEFISRC